MHERHRTPDLRIAERAQPAGLCRRVQLDPRPDGLDQEDVGQAGDDGFAARAHRPRLGCHEVQGTVHPLRLRRADRLDDDRAWQEPDQLPRGWVVEANDRAQQACRGAVTALTQHFVLLAQVLLRHVEQRDTWRTRLAGQAMSIAVRHERKIARMQNAWFEARDVEPALTPRHDVEHQRVLERGRISPQGAVKSHRL